MVETIARVNRAIALCAVAVAAFVGGCGNDSPRTVEPAASTSVGQAEPLDPHGEILAKYAEGASIPLTFVIGTSGDVVYRHQNFQSGDEVELERAIRRVAQPDAP